MPFNSGWCLSISQMSNVTTLHTIVEMTALNMSADEVFAVLR